MNAYAAAEAAARTSYGVLLALVAASHGDITYAEDCLADAFAQALARWPVDGVPANPNAWLLTVARNRHRDMLRSAHVRGAVAIDDAPELVAHVDATDDFDAIPDRRLALLFVCAHPAIDVSVRTPLMLQTVLGFDAAEVARAFAVPASAMAQRLVRAKQRIREARIPFVVPEREVMPARLTPVLEAIYGAYAIDFALVAGTQPRETLADEALWLAELLAALLPDEPEALGLAALIALSHARRDARGGETFVPLDEQDVTRYDLALVARGERHLHHAQSLGRVGRFQLEAAIQSVHCARVHGGATDWAALRTLHAALVRISPTLGARVAHAAAVGRIEGADAGLALLDAIDADAGERAARFQPAWATRAHLLADAGRRTDAIAAYTRAVDLTAEPAAREWLMARRSALSQ